MKRILSLMMAICLLATMVVPAYAAQTTATPLGSFEYTLQPSGKLLLTKYTGKDATVYIPAHYRLAGEPHPVELDSLTVFRGNETIEKVTLGEGIGFYNNTAATLFAQCPNLRSVIARNPSTAALVSMEYMFAASAKLTQVDLTGWDTGNVVSMRSMFSGCRELKKILGYEHWNTQKLKNISFMFDNTRSMEKVDLRQWDLSALNNSAWCFQTCYAQKILLPDNIAIISAGFLNHAAKYTGSSFTIPAGVKTIGYAHTFYDFATNDFKEFLIAPENTVFQAVDGILYTADGHKMLAIPRGKTFPGGTYQIPEEVTFLGELSFSRNYHVKKVILPNSYQLKTVAQYDDAYITYEDTGNLNAGLNLNVAIYLYSGVTEYEVKADNPNYQSRNGVIYSKDMSTLLAVPTRYQKYLDIPEGVTVWRSEAMWHGTKTINSQMASSGVAIPASMTDIAPDQVEKLNWLVENKSGFRISVSKDNPVYYLEKSGKLAQRPHLADLDIQVQTEGLVYDGTPKTPEVTIYYQNELLQKDKDYTLTYTENTNAGTGWVRVTALSGFYGTVERSFTIEKGVPEYTCPETLEAVYGQLLQDIALPDGFRFEKPMQWVGNTGENSFNLIYTSDDPNYRQVEQIPVTVTVSPKVVTLKNVDIPVQFWTGQPVIPKLSVTEDGLTVPEGEYTVAYTGNSAIGKATVTVTDNPGGNFAVSGTVHFWILPDPWILYIAVLAILTILAFRQNIRRKKAVLSKTPSQNP